MSDLASFVAVVLRDKVVLEQQEEIKNLKRKFDDFVANQRTLAIKEVANGDTTIYAAAQVDHDGEPMAIDDVARWYVHLTKQFPACPIDKLSQLEMSIGDKSRKLVDPSADGADYQIAHFMDGYDEEIQRGDVTLCVAPHLTVVHGTIGPISQQVYNTLVDEHDECNLNDFVDIVAAATGGGEEPQNNLTVEFDMVEFSNFAHTLWHIQD